MYISHLFLNPGLLNRRGNRDSDNRGVLKGRE